MVDFMLIKLVGKSTVSSHGIPSWEVPINGWSSSSRGFFLHTTPQFTTTAEGGVDDPIPLKVYLVTLRWERDL